jgi:FSR family fosmidomycin resistance protein-like MFS transporter
MSATATPIRVETATEAFPGAARTAMSILLAISFSHMLNDLIQSLLPAIYPLLKTSYGLSFAEIGWLAFTFQLTASLLQPVVGIYTDRRPLPYSLPIGMGSSLIGLLLLSWAHGLPMLMFAAGLVGLGSSIFHPESARVARMASGGKPGLAQSIFQVGGNAGSAIGPLMAAFIVVPFGQRSVGWFSLAALTGMIVLTRVGFWYAARIGTRGRPARRALAAADLPRRRVAITVAILLTLIFSKYFYMASINTYYTFYLIDHFHVPLQTAQIFLFVFLASAAVGIVAGGPLGDRFGRKYVIWGSILGVLPFTLALPFANLFWTVALTIPIGLILSSAFSAILVYAQELMPGRVGAVSGMFFGFAFGTAGVGAAALGHFADVYGISAVYSGCSLLPAIGLLAVFLPSIEKHRHAV